MMKIIKVCGSGLSCALMMKIIKVSGQSLQPVYQDGDFVLVSKIPTLWRDIRQGEIVVFTHPVYGTMIKMVHQVAPNDEQLLVVGTHRDSIDSRRFGAIDKRDVMGRVIWHMRKPSR